MRSIRRSCQSALQSSDSVCVYANGSRRAFSRSCPRSRGLLPVFLEPSSPELSTLLSTFNTKVLAPEHFSKEQQALVYRTANKAKLLAEPVEITLGDVTLPLEHIDRNHRPNRWATLREIVQKSKSREDYENVVRMLEGFDNAGIKLKPERQEFVVRHMNLNGMQSLVLKAVQRAGKTGVRMSEYRVLLQVLRGVHDKAALSDWDKDETIKMLRYARQIVELLEDEEHCGGKSRGDKVAENDWRGKPSVVAVPTEMAAVLADRHGGDVGEVKVLAGRLVGSLMQDGYETTLDATAAKNRQTSADYKNLAYQMTGIADLTKDLLGLIFVWNALKTSRKVLGSDMPKAQEAQQFENRAEQILKDGMETAEILKTRDGKKYPNALADYIKDAMARCQ